jgi:DNA-binding transcriptional ArsR family regulator
MDIMMNDHTFTPISDEIAGRLAELFRALGDPSRVRMIAVLAEGEASVSQLAELASISESSASHHLRGLRLMRLVRARKQGRQVFYSLDDDHIAHLFRGSLDHILHD